MKKMKEVFIKIVVIGLLIIGASVVVDSLIHEELPEDQNYTYEHYVREPITDFFEIGLPNLWAEFTTGEPKFNDDGTPYVAPVVEEETS